MHTTDQVFLGRLAARTLPQDENLQWVEALQSLAGRWLSLQRLRLGLTLEKLEALTRVPQLTLALLELGLAEDADLIEEQRLTLAEALTNQRWTAENVGNVLLVAVGRAADADENIAVAMGEDLMPTPPTEE